MKYTLTIGDSETIDYGCTKKIAWGYMVKENPHLIYCSKPEDLKRVGKSRLEDYLNHHRPEFSESRGI